VLCGLFPIEKRRSDRLPVKILSLWQYLFCMICTPLVRADCAGQCLDAFFDWLAAGQSGCSLMEFRRVAGEGPFNRVLVEQVDRRQLLSFTSESYARAMLIPSVDADSYLRRAMSGDHRKDLRRKQKRLSEEGQFEFDELQPGGSIEEWTEEFMKLEVRGWKGKLGGALASNEANRSFFTAVAKEAFYRGRLMMLAARMDGKPIAQKCNFLAGDGSFAFKIAYDENYAHYSPGMLLEMENIRRIHDRPEIKWMDSCAIPDHPMINRLWPDRRIIQTVLVPTRKGRGELFVSLMPLARWLRRKTLALTCRRRQNAEEVSK
jgi:Acetyltransferase (GNAT) domain